MHRKLLTAAIAALVALASSAAAQTDDPSQTDGPSQGGAPAQADAPSARQLADGLINLYANQAYGSHCGVLSPFDSQAIRSSIAVLQARVTANPPPGGIAAVLADVQKVETKAGAHPCTGPGTDSIKYNLQQEAIRDTAYWMQSASGILAASKAPWAANISTLETQAAAVKANDGFGSGDAKARASARGNAEALATRMLMLVCPQRRTVRASAPRACPAVTPVDASEIYVATVWLAEAEAFGTALAAAVAALPAPAAVKSGPAAPAAAAVQTDGPVQGAAPSQAAAPAQAAPRENALVVLNRFQSQGTRCGWLTPLGAQALRSGIAVQEAGIQTYVTPEVRAFVRADVQKAVTAVQAEPCTGARADEDRLNLQESVDAIITASVIRAYGILVASETPWAQGISTVEPLSPVIKAGMNALLKQQEFNEIDDAQGRAVDEARRALTIVCSERRTVRVATPRDCPVITPQQRTLIPYALAWLTQVEAFSDAFVAAQRPRRFTGAGAPIE